VSHMNDMPTTAYHCRECARSLELDRSMAESSSPAGRLERHEDTVELSQATASKRQSAAPTVRRADCLGGWCA
jgi:hypothetical protein